MSDNNNNSIRPDYSLVKRLSDKLSTESTIWIVIAIFQILSCVGLPMGVYNIVVSIQQKKYSQKILNDPRGICATFEPLSGSIITLIFNMFFGALIGVAGSLYHIIGIRGFVMDHRDEFERIELDFNGSGVPTNVPTTNPQYYVNKTSSKSSGMSSLSIIILVFLGVGLIAGIMSFLIISRRKSVSTDNVRQTSVFVREQTSYTHIYNNDSSSAVTTSTSASVPVSYEEICSVDPSNVVTFTGEINENLTSMYFDYTAPRDGLYEFVIQEDNDFRYDVVVTDIYGNRALSYSFTGVQRVNLSEGMDYQIECTNYYDPISFTLMIIEQKETAVFTQPGIINDSFEFEGQVNNYTFTPEQSGEYTLQINSDTVYAEVEVTDIYSNSIASYRTASYDDYSVTLSAGSEYSISVTDTIGVGDYEFMIVEAN